MSEFEQISSETQAALTNLAMTTREELMRAGLPVREDPHSDVAGAEIEVDFGDDDAGGVFVTWHADESLTKAAAKSALEGRLDDVSIRQSGIISQAMRDSMIAVLRAARYGAGPSDDDMRPLALRVFTGPL